MFSVRVFILEAAAESCFFQKPEVLIEIGALYYFDSLDITYAMGVFLMKQLLTPVPIKTSNIR